MPTTTGSNRGVTASWAASHPNSVAANNYTIIPAPSRGGSPASGIVSQLQSFGGTNNSGYGGGGTRSGGGGGGGSTTTSFSPPTPVYTGDGRNTSGGFVPVTQKTGASSTIAGQKTALSSLIGSNSDNNDPNKKKKNSNATAFNAARDASKAGTPTQLTNGYFENGAYKVGKMPTAKAPDTPKTEPNEPDPMATKDAFDKTEVGRRFLEELDAQKDVAIDDTEVSAADMEAATAEAARRGYDRDIQSGIENLSQQRIPLNFVTGQQAALQRNAAVQQGNLLDAVAVAQAKRQAAMDRRNKIIDSNNSRRTARATNLNSYSDAYNKYLESLQPKAQTKNDIIDLGRTKVMVDSKGNPVKTYNVTPIKTTGVAAPKNQFTATQKEIADREGMSEKEQIGLSNDIKEFGAKALVERAKALGNTDMVNKINLITNYAPPVAATTTAAPKKSGTWLSNLIK